MTGSAVIRSLLRRRVASDNSIVNEQVNAARSDHIDLKQALISIPSPTLHEELHKSERGAAAPRHVHKCLVLVDRK